MADITPYHFPGDTYTGHANVAVTGGRAVAVVGARVDGNYRFGLPAAGARIDGVASRDKVAGEKVMVFGPGTIVDGEAGAAITAGQNLEVNAAGNFVPVATGTPVARAMDDIASGARGPVRLL